ncbi:MAG: bacteriohopanetetrol glucosamine biosynthesis glycosyltransferase HpnI [Terracidiphilus sp.]|nr:bacteriohopanetetrol glucosamine biosynthesis glycosyltransferase HpnI [Terracidiphilus sp.]
MTPHHIALAIEVLTTTLTIASLGYLATAWVAARLFLRQRRHAASSPAPSVTILKSLKGLDPGMLDAFRSHCRQTYTGDYELLFGVSSLSDPAVAAVLDLQREFPDRAIRLIECPQNLGANGKVSTLIQLVPHARNEILLVNDSDITVSPHYLECIVAGFSAPSHDARPVGLVSALYRGHAHSTLPSRLEALTISTGFQPSVLLAKVLERGLHYGLGSTLAVRREALDAIGGFPALADQLADDYELGARIDRSGFRIVLSPEVVETSVPPYSWRGFFDHQLRWLRTVRDARPGGYIGLLFTQTLALALLNTIASGLSPLSLWLLGLAFFLRLTVAMTVGSLILADHQVLPSLWLLPLNDVLAFGLWAAGFASDMIVWRGHRFHVRNGRLHAAD